MSLRSLPKEKLTYRQNNHLFKYSTETIFHGAVMRPSKDCNFVVVEGLVCSRTPRAMPSGVIILLVGPPKAIRSRARNQTNSNLSPNQSPQRQSRRKTSLHVVNGCKSGRGLQQRVTPQLSRFPCHWVRIHPLPRTMRLSVCNGISTLKAVTHKASTKRYINSAHP